MKFRVIAVFTMLMFASGTPLARAQQDVHAALLPAADRKPAPAFNLPDETGKKIQISDYRGKVVLLNFWATDYGGCVLEIPSFIAIESAHRGENFTAVGISMDVSYRISRMRKKHGQRSNRLSQVTR